MNRFAHETFKRKYAITPTETWIETSQRVASNVLGALGYKPRSDEVTETARLIAERKFMPGGRYLYASGRNLHQVNNCLLMRCEDSREGWSQTFWQASMSLMTGAGVGVDYSAVRPKGSKISRTGGLASGPLSPMRIVNELGRDIQQGGSRRSAIWAGLSWRHPDVLEFIRLKDWPEELRRLKAEDWTLPMELELTNISVQLDDEFFDAYHDPAHPETERARTVFHAAVERMAKTGEPGFSVDTGVNAGETLRNACTEVTSYDDSDICNLGSPVLPRITDVSEFRAVLELSNLFLLAGTVYSDVPYERVATVRERNRRLGLGLLGVHEWLLQRGRSYAPDPELERWLEVYAASTELAGKLADAHSLSRPVKTRAVAPNGTIGIVAETTTGIEPIFCAAYKRTFLTHGHRWRTEYVLDPVAERLVEQGVNPERIEDAYSIPVARRLAIQAWAQRYVDHGISSTVNLPEPITHPIEVEVFERQLLRYLPELRGVTVYPNGARAGQPIVAVPYAEAADHHASAAPSPDVCINGSCGI